MPARAASTTNRTAAAPFAERLPTPALIGAASRVWTRRSGASPLSPPARVLPDGCVDLLVQLAPAAPDGVLELDVVGPMTTAIVVRPTAGVATIGVRMRSGHALALLGRPASELADLRVPLAALHPDAARLRDLVAAAAGAGADDALAVARALEAWLAGRVQEAAAPPPDVRAAVREVVRSGGRRRVDALAASLGVTRQHLARQFARHVGVAPKTLLRIARLRRAMRLARIAGPPRWSAIAHDAGYADQAHLVDDFAELAGTTPARWWAEG